MAFPGKRSILVLFNQFSASIERTITVLINGTRLWTAASANENAAVTAQPCERAALALLEPVKNRGEFGVASSPSHHRI